MTQDDALSADEATRMDQPDATTLFLLNVLMALLLAVGVFGYKVLIAFGLLGAMLGVPMIVFMFLDAAGFLEWLRFRKQGKTL